VAGADGEDVKAQLVGRESDIDVDVGIRHELR
jgi:hypothetical protein